MSEELQVAGPVFMLSGQGSQTPGMGVDLLGISEVAESFECASDFFHLDVAKLVKDGTADDLASTVCAQAAILSLSVGIARALMARGVQPSAVLGFSLGQIGALTISGMLGLEDMFALAEVRARLMGEAAQKYPGAMCALLGADEDAAWQLCEECAHGEVLVVANCNCPGQIVISGEKAAVTRASEAWGATKKRSAMLATEGAFHSPLLAQAAEQLALYMAGVRFAEARIPLICNVDAQPLRAADAPEHLRRHLVEPVRFESSVRLLLSAGATEFVETGFGGVLQGLVKRIDRGVSRPLVSSLESFDEYLASSKQAM